MNLVYLTLSDNILYENKTYYKKYEKPLKSIKTLILIDFKGFYVFSHLLL